LNLLVGSLIIGLLLALMSLGVYISFRIFDFPDITVDGSITLGAAVAAVLIISGVNPLFATLAAALAGAAAGVITGVIHTRFHIHALLSGILVMTALYSVNLHVMGRSNIPLMAKTTLGTWAEIAWRGLINGAETLNVMGWDLATSDAAILLFSLIMIGGVGILLYGFFRTGLGTAMRATGDNPQMIRALGSNTGTMIIIGLGLSNGLVAFSGALLAQFQGFADVQMGIGMIVWGLASVILGEALVRGKGLGLAIAGTVMGSVLFRLLIAIALRFGMDPNNLKLITAVFVFAALVLPGMMSRMHAWKKGASRA
jgi:putative tryptophan/tyrosine transport system permease protein